MANEEPMINFKNKRGEVNLKDIILILLVFSGIIALSGIFVSEIGNSYDNVNMTSSYNQDSIGEKNLTSTSQTFADLGERMRDGGLDAWVAGISGVFQVFIEVLKAPATFVSMLVSVLSDFGVDGSIVLILQYVLSGILYALIIFAISAAVMQRSTPV